METRGRRSGEASPEHAPTGHFFDQLTQTLTFGHLHASRLSGFWKGVPWPPCWAWASMRQRTDKSCAGKAAISNTVCPRPRFCRRRFCACARTVGGDKKCVDLRYAHCPSVDECDSNSACWRQCPH